MTSDTLIQFQFFLLLGYAATATTLVGFIGLVYTNEERRNKPMNSLDSSSVFHLLFAGLSTLFLSLLAIVSIISLKDNLDLAWRVNNGLSAMVHIIGTFRLNRETWHVREMKRRGWIMTVIGWTVAGFSVAATAGYLSDLNSTIFLLATMWALAVCAISFIALVMTRPKSSN